MNIVPRAVWTRQKWRTLVPLRLPTPRLYVHHGAVGSPTLATLLAYERFHVPDSGRGWGRLGYNYAITGDGTVYEGCGPNIGAHAAGNNATSLGVCLVGDWSRLTPPRPMVEALADLTVELTRRRLLNAAAITGGHRDAPSASTSCPGVGGMRAVAEARRLIVQRLNAPTTTPPPPEEDIIASIDDLKKAIADTQPPPDPLVRERINEAVRLGEAAALAGVAAMRHAAGLPPDSESDAIQVRRLRTGTHRGEPYRIDDVRQALEERAATEQAG